MLSLHCSTGEPSHLLMSHHTAQTETLLFISQPSKLCHGQLCLDQLQAEEIHSIGTHNHIHPSPVHPAFSTQPAPVAAHSHQLPTQAGDHADYSNAAPEQSVLQSEATGGMFSQYGKDREAWSPPAGSQATDFSRFSLTALPSSRKC